MPQHLETVSAKEMARLSGVTLSAVTNWKAEGCPHAVDERGRVVYVPADVTNWRIERAGQSAAPLDKDAEQVRKLKAEADFKELEVAKVREELVPVTEFAKALALAQDDTRAAMTSLPSKHARLLVERTGCSMAVAQTVLAEIADATLAEMQTAEPSYGA
jgi:terminase small subunit / prophage DNA-packing protein